MSMEYGEMIVPGDNRTTLKNDLSQFHAAHHKSHKDGPGYMRVLLKLNLDSITTPRILEQNACLFY
jgi:hypothetical protein